ncbi:hypothetical protein MMC27_003692 [Xylographa pallens]|nr:hypothetical protein [Xylographa pallens]
MQLPTLLALLTLLLTPTLGTVLSKPVNEPGSTDAYNEAGQAMPGQPVPAGPQPKHPATPPTVPQKDSTKVHGHLNHHSGKHWAPMVARRSIKDPVPVKKAKKVAPPKPVQKDDDDRSFGPPGSGLMHPAMPIDPKTGHVTLEQLRHGYYRRRSADPAARVMFLRDIAKRHRLAPSIGR